MYHRFEIFVTKILVYVSKNLMPRLKNKVDLSLRRLVSKEFLLQFKPQFRLNSLIAQAVIC